MQLETVSKIKGWCALALLAPVILLFMLAPLHLATVPLIRVALVSFLIGILVGISWVRQRNWMRRQSYAGRQVLGR